MIKRRIGALRFDPSFYSYFGFCTFCKTLVTFVFLPVIVITGLAVIPDALALHASAVFLPVAPLDEGPATSLAEGNIGLAAVIIQCTGINGSKATQGKIGGIDGRIHHRLHTDLLCFIVEHQLHRKFRQVAYDFRAQFLLTQLSTAKPPPD